MLREIYIRPIGLYASARGEAADEVWGGMPLAGGWLDFSAIEVIEDYRGKGVEEGRRALLLRLGYRAADRSVTDAEVQTLHDAIVSGALRVLHDRDPQARPR